MSIEKLIEANTAAVEENTAVQKRILAILEEGQGKKPAKDDKADKEESRGSRSRDRDDRESSRDRDDDRGSRSRRDRDEDKDEGRGSRSSRSRDDDKDEDRGSRGSSRSRDDDKADKKADKPARGAGKPKKPKLADVRAAFATFMEVDPKDYKSDADAKDEEEDRRKFVEDVLDAVKADKTSDIQEEDFERVLAWIAEATEKGPNKVDLD